MKINEFVDLIESLCPSSLAEEWDNCGFQVNCVGQEIKRVLVALEVTNAIIDEAIENRVDLILTHHPMLFQGVKKIEKSDVIGGYIFKLIENGISVYSCHTSFDKLAGGNNDYLGELLELNYIQPFEKDNGFCRKGYTPFETTFLEVIHKAAEAFEIEERHFRYVGNLSKQIDTIGWCTGAGSEFLQAAFDEGCDLYITGDVKYHEAQLAKEMGICVLDAGHFGSEKIFAENMAKLLRSRLPSDVTVIESLRDLNPFG